MIRLLPGPSSIPLDTGCSWLCCSTIGSPDDHNDADNVDDKCCLGALVNISKISGVVITMIVIMLMNKTIKISLIIVIVYLGRVVLRTLVLEATVEAALLDLEIINFDKCFTFDKCMFHTYMCTYCICNQLNTFSLQHLF